MELDIPGFNLGHVDEVIRAAIVYAEPGNEEGKSWIHRFDFDPKVGEYVATVDNPSGGSDIVRRISPNTIAQAMLDRAAEGNWAASHQATTPDDLVGWFGTQESDALLQLVIYGGPTYPRY
jgi:hypothetical protein